MTATIDVEAKPGGFRSDQQVIQQAEAVAAELRATELERDRDPSLVADASRAIAQSGLLALAVPAKYGGPGSSRATVVEVFRIIAAADAAVAASLVSHFVLVDAVVRLGHEDLRGRVLPEVLDGVRLGGTCGHKPPLGSVVLAADHALVSADGYHGNGALAADWIGAVVEDDSGRVTIGIVPNDAPGLSITTEPWSFGQRAGTVAPVTLNRVKIPLSHVIPEWRSLDGPTVRGSFDQLLHTAIDIGTARGALDGAREFIQRTIASTHGGGEASGADEVSIAEQVGDLASDIFVAEAALRDTARRLDAALAEGLTDRNTAELSIDVAALKSHASKTVIRTTNEILELAGIEGTITEHRLDRFWRNARTHTLHDPVRWKYRHIGRFVLNETPPPKSSLI